ncbi:hypothetical protein ASPWEDRAFT_60025 [Aspergillus wentii DTO 134E9]|uniref:Uncharacterized protein n=1 Tax=Aspergillus wentii DTO 134E9 TaxID=1073089 RepID=A0A1L9RLL0_ASPWE|nr:uncharacterized protein ASPWEDRAFT_60025 [Aspergillus wentii DTO 134E9]OJJ35829.1 hypothetical protein ASPWEDRAFT_60025 [Aspergillus wentii DTO 134E9]
MPKELRDNVSRTKGPSPIGKSIFIGLRAADVFWQYNLLRRSWGMAIIEKLGGHAAPAIQVLHPVGLTGLRPYYDLVSLFSLGSSVKQIAHMALVSEQEMSTGSAVAIAAFNTIFNSVNTLFSLWAVSSPASSISYLSNWKDTLSNPLIAVGVGAYTIGILTEAISEFQRKAFKNDPANKGKPYAGGLFSLARNINYGGYTIWRTGYALATGGIAWGIATFAFYFADFATRGVPVLEEYLTSRYGDAYEEVKSRVPYSLIPGIY